MHTNCKAARYLLPFRTLQHDGHHSRAWRCRIRAFPPLILPLEIVHCIPQRLVVVHTDFAVLAVPVLNVRNGTCRDVQLGCSVADERLERGRCRQCHNDCTVACRYLHFEVGACHRRRAFACQPALNTN